MPFESEKMYKLAAGERFFDLNDLWYFLNRWAVRVLYPLPVSANQITFLSLVFGMAAAGFYLSGSSHALIYAAGFLYGKIFLDNVDGNLARIRGEVSRAGRFFDSLTDFVVTLLVYSAITWRLAGETGEASLWILGFFAVLSTFLHCSYFVFYLVSYTSMVGSYTKNRVREDITPEDRNAYSQGELPGLSYFLQRAHGLVYGWQDRLMGFLDRVSRGATGWVDSPGNRRRWYTDKRFLTLASPLCLCTNNMILVVCSLSGRLEWGFMIIVFAGNAYLAGIQLWKIFRARWGGQPG